MTAPNPDFMREAIRLSIEKMLASAARSARWW
jgi:hypothetical protein